MQCQATGTSPSLTPQSTACPAPLEMCGVVVSLQHRRHATSACDLCRVGGPRGPGPSCCGLPESPSCPHGKACWVAALSVPVMAGLSTLFECIGCGPAGALARGPAPPNLSDRSGTHGRRWAPLFLQRFQRAACEAVAANFRRVEVRVRTERSGWSRSHGHGHCPPLEGSSQLRTRHHFAGGH